MARHSSHQQEMVVTGPGCYRPACEMRTYHLAIKHWMKVNGIREGDRFVLELHLPKRLQDRKL